ncbi:MAG: isocitrate lyase [Gemmatimonadota bacterium]
MSKGNGSEAGVRGAAAVTGREAVAELERSWREDPRWEGIERGYDAAEVVTLRGSLVPEHTIARRGAETLWQLLTSGESVRALGALTGAQAVQMVQAGLKSIYVSGWQVAGDMNSAGQTYPDQSLYPADSVPKLVARINAALRRADQVDHLNDGKPSRDWFAPIVADAEAGFGGVLNAFELMRAMIEAGAAGVHFEDQLSSFKKCGHMGGKVLAPTGEAIHKLIAARLAADVAGVPTLLVARTDANAAGLLANNVDERDHEFVTGERTSEGFFHVRAGLDQAIARGLAYAPWADIVWCETAHPDLGEAKRFAEAIHAEHPGKLLAYNCSPSFNWAAHLDGNTIAKFQRELSAMGYLYQFVTLAGFHSVNAHMFELAKGYCERDMSAYSELQEREFELERDHGYRAVKHQSFVGAGWFDRVTQLVSGGRSATTAMQGSTEEEQFQKT